MNAVQERLPPDSERAASAMIADLQRIVDPARVLHSETERTPFESDGLTAFRARPLAVVLVETQQEIVDLVRWCHSTSTPFVARGSGTSLSGGSMPIEQGVVLALNRLNKILEIRPEDRICRVEPGVINLHVSEAVKAYGLYYAPDPSSQPICTIGGNVAFNSGGAHCLKYGMTSNHVLEMKIVLPTGEVETIGRPSLEGIGPDLHGLFVGSEGRFGVALEMTLRLLPLVPMYKTVLAAYTSQKAAGDAVSRIVASGLLPGAIEIMDSLSIEAAEVSVNAGYPKNAAAILIVELEGEEEQVALDFTLLSQLLQDSGAYEIRVAKTEAERMRIWKGRKSAFSAVGRLSPDYIVQDGVVPRSRLGEALQKIVSLGDQYGIRVANVFHAGDGNLHPLILFDGREEGALHRAEELAGEILHMCIDMGGSITGEHGVGMEKRDYLPSQYQGRDLKLLYDLRLAMDPAGVANQGKMLKYDTMPAPLYQAGDLELPASYSSSARDCIHSLSELIAISSCIQIQGGGSKTAGPSGDATLLPATDLAGIVEYDPTEFTFTAFAGTTIVEVQELLEAEGQYLPFCPPAHDGATLGGTLACGLSGEGRWRYGGIRDFILGVRFLDGEGQLLYSGARVVKNAAGFDIPKLLVGSLGGLALMVEVTFKVFPLIPSYGTLICNTHDIGLGVKLLQQAARGPFDISGLCLQPQGDSNRLFVRLGGDTEALSARLTRLAEYLRQDSEILLDDRNLWEEFDAWSNTEAECVWRVPITPSRIEGMEQQLRHTQLQRRYSMAGNLLWLHGNPTEPVDDILQDEGLAGLALRARKAPALHGVYPVNPFLTRIKRVLDPQNRFASPLPFAGVNSS